MKYVEVEMVNSAMNAVSSHKKIEKLCWSMWNVVEINLLLSQE